MKRVTYLCNNCTKQIDTERERTSIRGQLRIESGVYDAEKYIEVDIDLCPVCAEEAFAKGFVKVPIADGNEIEFEGTE